MSTSEPSNIRQRIKREWGALWDQRIEDRHTAEQMARRHYELLFLEKGTVIKATKDYKPPDLQEILEKNGELLGVKLTSPDAAEAGWEKFARTVLAQQHRWRRVRPEDRMRTRNGPPKQGGRGWIHQ